MTDRAWQHPWLRIQRLIRAILEVRRDGSPRLFVGEQVEGELVYRGTVELGVRRALVAELLKRSSQRRTSPFGGFRSRKVTWLEPTVAIEVSYGRLRQGWLREPACRRLADDIGSARRNSRPRSATAR